MPNLKAFISEPETELLFMKRVFFFKKFCLHNSGIHAEIAEFEKCFPPIHADNYF